MKTTVYIKQILIAIAVLLSFSAYSQEINKTKIIGTWYFDKLEFIKTTEFVDTAEMLKSSTGVILTFKEGNKFVTNRKTGNETELVESGDYSLSPDGKYILQNNDRAEILLLNDVDFVFKVEGVVIVHLKKESH